MSKPYASGKTAPSRLRLPTSAVLVSVLRDAPEGDVTLEWIVARLRERSFGIVMLIIALVGLVPGISPLAGVVLTVPAIQMIRAREAPVLPRFVTTRRFSTPRFARLIERVVPVLQRLEKVVRPRWPTPFETTKRLVGFVILLLCPTLLAPIPFSNILPTFVIMLLAFAFLEEDGILLCIALASAAVSIAVTTAAVWGTIEAGLAL